MIICCENNFILSTDFSDIMNKICKAKSQKKIFELKCFCILNFQNLTFKFVILVFSVINVSINGYKIVKTT